MDLQNMDDEELDKEGEVKEKPGGCGCRVAGAPRSPSAPSALVAVLMLGALALRRRR
jgi:MYXO-CTERM domain-containing protein